MLIRICKFLRENSINSLKKFGGFDNFIYLYLPLHLKSYE